MMGGVRHPAAATHASRGGVRIGAAEPGMS